MNSIPLNTTFGQVTNSTEQHPTIDDILRVHPLPAALAHLEPLLRKLPNFGILLDISVACVDYGIDENGFERILEAVVNIYSDDSHRCAACFVWTSEFHTICTGSTDNLIVLPICDRCMDRIETGRATRQMQRNLRSYGGAQ